MPALGAVAVITGTAKHKRCLQMPQKAKEGQFTADQKTARNNPQSP